MSMSKGERDELRRIVRGDFKALRGEIEVRQAELVAEIERRVADRYMAHESVIVEMGRDIGDIVYRANKSIAEVVAKAQKACYGYVLEVGPLFAPLAQAVREQRNEMRRAMMADLAARVAHAKSVMTRQEIDLLKRLSVGALESSEARDFLGEIPTVAELVPASRLAELEAQFGDFEGA